MKLSCLCCERLLSYRVIEACSLPESGWIRRHTDGCLACAESWRELSQLTRRLSDVNQSPSDGPSQRAAILERTAKLPGPPRNRLATSTAFAAAAILLVVWFASRPDRISEPSLNAPVVILSQRSSSKVTIAEVPKSIDKRKTPATERKATKAYSKQARQKRRVRIRRPVMLARAIDSVERTPNTSVSQEPAHQQTASITTVKWEQIGAWYEAGGDHRSALAAYAKAFEDRPTPELAFTAGRAAECAGDISSAVDYYARALEPKSESESEPEKGSVRCIDALSSV